MDLQSNKTVLVLYHFGWKNTGRGKRAISIGIRLYTVLKFGPWSHSLSYTPPWCNLKYVWLVTCAPFVLTILCAPYWWRNTYVIALLMQVQSTLQHVDTWQFELLIADFLMTESLQINPCFVLTKSKLEQNIKLGFYVTGWTWSTYPDTMIGFRQTTPQHKS